MTKPVVGMTKALPMLLHQFLSRSGFYRGSSSSAPDVGLPYPRDCLAKGKKYAAVPFILAGPQSFFAVGGYSLPALFYNTQVEWLNNDFASDSFAKRDLSPSNSLHFFVAFSLPPFGVLFEIPAGTNVSGPG